jgi:hypothetical protein
MIRSLSEIIADSAAQVKHKDKVRVLVENDCPALRIILCCALHPLIEWELPAGTPPYTPNGLAHDQEGVLYHEMRRLYMFLKPNHVYHEYRQMRQHKRENSFIQLLEMVDREDAKLLIAAKNKTLPVKGLWWQIVEAAFPGIITEPKSEQTPASAVTALIDEPYTVDEVVESAPVKEKAKGHPHPGKGKPRDPAVVAKMRATWERKKAEAALLKKEA